MLKKEVTSLALHYRMREFLLDHQSHYSKEEREFLMKNYLWGKRCNFVPDLLRQVYDELGVIEEDKNIYCGFLSLLEDKFSLDQNMIEIGGGRTISGIARRIALKQKRGTVTVYDPSLITERASVANLVLKSEVFTKDTRLNGATLLYGFMPCGATSLLFDVAGRNNIDFMVALCDGEGEGDYIEGMEDYQAHMIYEARKIVRENNMGTLEFESLEHYDDPYPVLYNKRK